MISPFSEFHIVNCLVNFGRDEILKEWGIDSCIASTRIGLLVLFHFGYSARPMPCRVTAMHKTAWVRYNHDPSQFALKPDEYSIGIGFRGFKHPAPQGSQLPGHLIIFCDPENYFVDLSLDQASRPERQMLLGPACFNLPPPVARQDAEAFVFESRPTTPGNPQPPVILYYELFPESREFHCAPDWFDVSRHRDTVGRIIARIEKGDA